MDFETYLFHMFRQGSLVADFEVEYDDSQEAQLLFTNSNIDLLNNKEILTIQNETAPVLDIQINNTTCKCLWAILLNNLISLQGNT